MDDLLFNQTSGILDQIELLVFYLLFVAVDAIWPSNYLLFSTVQHWHKLLGIFRFLDVKDEFYFISILKNGSENNK